MTITEIISDVASILSAIAALVVSLRTKGIVAEHQKTLAAHQAIFDQALEAGRMNQAAPQKTPT